MKPKRVAEAIERLDRAVNYHRDLARVHLDDVSVLLEAYMALECQVDDLMRDIACEGDR